MVALEQETALITGAGRGIGRAVAQSYARAGAAVGLMARSTDQIDRVAADITQAGGRAVAITGDVTNASDVQRAVHETSHQFGPISVLVSNAGITGPFAPVWDTDADEWWQTLEVHVRGAFFCARAVWAGMVARGCGRIILVSSRAAENAGTNTSAYAIAKAGQLRLAEALAAEGVEYGIRAFALSPGFVDTQFPDDVLQRSDAARYAPQFVARLKQLRRDPSLGTPIDHVADLCMFLASGRGDGLSGRYLRAEDYDWEQLAQQADIIKQGDLYTLRLRTLPGSAGSAASPGLAHQ